MKVMLSSFNPKYGQSIYFTVSKFVYTKKKIAKRLQYFIKIQYAYAIARVKLTIPIELELVLPSFGVNSVNQ